MIRNDLTWNKIFCALLNIKLSQSLATTSPWFNPLCCRGSMWCVDHYGLVVPDGLTQYIPRICTRFLLRCALLWLYIDWFPISIRLISLALWQSNDYPSASKATLMNMDKYFTWIHYEQLHNHNKAKHNKTVCIFLGIYCMIYRLVYSHQSLL